MQWDHIQASSHYCIAFTHLSVFLQKRKIFFFLYSLLFFFFLFFSLFFALSHVFLFISITI